MTAFGVVKINAAGCKRFKMIFIVKPQVVSSSESVREEGVASLAAILEAVEDLYPGRLPQIHQVLVQAEELVGVCDVLSLRL